MKSVFAAGCFLLCAAILTGCGEERPGLVDGANNLALFAVDTSGVSGSEWTAIPGATVRISSIDFFFQEEYVTNGEGYIDLSDLPAGTYNISAEKINSEENYMIIGQASLSLLYDPASVDTIFMNYQTSSPITMNEIYYCGCRASSFYYADQYIELYNSSSETIYLDGYLMCRGTQIADVIDAEAEDYALAYLVFSFPGERGVTQECPIEAGEYIVIASDALDHHRWYDTCVDLSGADWEFFNPLGSDYDNPEVPNLSPVMNLTSDFALNLSHTSVWIATGEEWEFGVHFDGNNMKEYIHIPLETILDGVEYASNTDITRYMTVRIDAGLAGLGMTKYSARSVQRRFPGLDSNNSTFDFIINEIPTPGYQ
ncbi:MAG: DUF4876 domain-containing protein [Candidatus Krumholzibacteria bacterium]|nr:DUF4876 domain-containing protein [Candidatus Krumholzibacteria bacterium]